jgi:hypothetical protein|tara:strand:+ start:1744 stop:1983 length:240 start_codon:yes stop_codon:yes gene_type:complete
MFTVEFDQDCTEIVVLDQSGEFEDVLVSLFDDYCYIEQYSNETNSYQRIMLTSEMYYKLMMAWQSSEGTYILEKNGKSA